MSKLLISALFLTQATFSIIDAKTSKNNQATPSPTNWTYTTRLPTPEFPNFNDYIKKYNLQPTYSHDKMAMYYIYKSDGKTITWMFNLSSPSSGSQSKYHLAVVTMQNNYPTITYTWRHTKGSTTYGDNTYYLSSSLSPTGQIVRIRGVDNGGEVGVSEPIIKPAPDENVNVNSSQVPLISSGN